MKHKYPRVYRFTLLLVASVLLLPAVQAKQPDRSPGVYIPVLKNAHVDDLTATRWVENAAGGYLEVLSSASEAWDALDQALTSLGIKPVKKDAASRQWLTDWVVWKYNKRKGTGRSKPAFSFGGRSLERHQFLMTVKPGSNREHAVIIIVDKKREREEDLTPDSMASWLEWKPRDLQQGAADTFLQRLQLPIESALATKFVVTEEITRTNAGDIVVTETMIDTSADVVLITIPEADVTSLQPQTPEPTPAASDEPIRKPKPAVARENMSRQPVKTAQEPVEAAASAGKTMPEQPPVPELQPAEQVTLQPEPAAIRMAKSPQSAQRARETVATQPQTMPVEEARLPRPPEQPEMKKPPAAPVASAVATAEPQIATSSHTKAVIQPDMPVKPAANGLLVSASPAVAWPALLQALHDLEIPVDRKDGQQHLLTTGWVNADYDKKNHLLVLRSEEGPMWAFNVFGKGIERQQFQIVMVPANQGVRSIIYAYNTGYQQQIDQTPDSSQTLLVWADQDTSPDLALAFLRQLRIVIPH
jgi:hypothetical protein